jgi:hypothetical protein
VGFAFRLSQTARCNGFGIIVVLLIVRRDGAPTRRTLNARAGKTKSDGRVIARPDSNFNTVTRYWAARSRDLKWGVELAPDQFGCYVNRQMPRTRHPGSLSAMHWHAFAGLERSGLELIFTRYFTR